jgi:hypothetical protein
MYGFYKGLIPTCIKVVPGAAVTFLCYEETLKVIQMFQI